MERPGLLSGPVSFYQWCLVGRAVVDPALGDDVERGDAEPVDEAHVALGRRTDEDGVQQHRDGRERGKRREYPDVSDVANDRHGRKPDTPAERPRREIDRLGPERMPGPPHRHERSAPKLRPE